MATLNIVCCANCGRDVHVHCVVAGKDYYCDLCLGTVNVSEAIGREQIEFPDIDELMAGSMSALNVRLYAEIDKLDD